MCILYIVYILYTKAPYINENVYCTCTVLAIIKDRPLLGMLLSKAEISYNIQLNNENCWLWQPSNKHFQSILCYQSISHCGINAEIFSQKKNKRHFVQEQCPEQNFTFCFIGFTSYSRKKPLASLTSLATTLNNFGTRIETITTILHY